MPAKSKTQKRLMGWAYACKNGKVKDCPDTVKKVGDGMTNKQLKKFFEGMAYKTNKANKALLKDFLIWMDNRHIEYIYNEEDEELEIYNEFELGKSDNETLLSQVAKLGLQKIWEADLAQPGTHLGNLGNVTGQGSVRPPGKYQSGESGSGDRFDNIANSYDDDDDDDDDKKKSKKRKHKEKDKEQQKELETEKKKNAHKSKVGELRHYTFAEYLNEIYYKNREL